MGINDLFLRLIDKHMQRVFNITLKIVCLLLFCLAQMGCALLQLPFDLLSSAVGTAVSAGVAAAPYVAAAYM